MIAATCEVFLDGVWFPSTPADAAAGRPVVLAPLSLEWGRTSTAEQPDASTATFAVRVFDPPPDVLSVVHVGTVVEVWAAGQIPAPDYDPNTYADPGFDTAPPGPPGNLAHAVGGTAEIVAGTARLTPTAAAALVVPARPYTPADPFSWDTLPAATIGDHWQAGLTVTAPIGVPVEVTVTGYTAPDPAAATPITLAAPPPTLIGTGGPQHVTFSLTLAAAAGPVWLALGVTVAGTLGTWADAAGAWSGQVGAWSDYPHRGRYVAVDNLTLAPQSASTRRVLVHSGQITDLAWSAVNDTALDLAVISVDMSADLGNRVVGDTPWPVTDVATRAARVVELTGLPVELRVDTTVGDTLLSARDVDALVALDLLRDIAQSAGAVLWPATHATTGPYLWIEDPGNRAAVRVLVVDTDTGLVVVDHLRQNAADVIVVSACDIIRDPVTWRQSVADVVTAVDVAWLEQTLDDDGLPAPTERHEYATDEAAAARYGVNRDSVTTELVSAADAAALAGRLLLAASSLSWRVDGIMYDTALVDDTIVTLDNQTRMSALMSLLDGTTRIGLGVTLVDVPAYAPPAGDTLGAYVEGGTYTYDNDAWALELRLAPSPAAGDTATWADLDPAWSWAEFDPSVSWADLYGTGVA